VSCSYFGRLSKELARIRIFLYAELKHLCRTQIVSTC
jgi:hypothetical protein